MSVPNQELINLVEKKKKFNNYKTAATQVFTENPLPYTPKRNRVYRDALMDKYGPYKTAEMEYMKKPNNKYASLLNRLTRKRKQSIVLRKNRRTSRK